jgi:hypothetical protein
MKKLFDFSFLLIIFLAFPCSFCISRAEQIPTWFTSQIKQRLALNILKHIITKLPPALTLSNSALCPHSVGLFMKHSISFSEYTAIIYLNSLNQLDFVIATQCTSCEAWLNFYALFTWPTISRFSMVYLSPRVNPQLVHKFHVSLHASRADIHIFLISDKPVEGRCKYIE